MSKTIDQLSAKTDLEGNDLLLLRDGTVDRKVELSTLADKLLSGTISTGSGGSNVGIDAIGGLSSDPNVQAALEAIWGELQDLPDRITSLESKPVIQSEDFSTGPSFTVGADNDLLVNTGVAASDVTVTLPYYSYDRELTLMLGDMGGFSVSLDASGYKINGSTDPYVLSTAYPFVRLRRFPGGYDWQVLGSSRQESEMPGFASAGSDNDFAGNAGFDLLSASEFDTYPQRFGSLDIPASFVKPGTVIEIEADFFVEYGGYGGGSFTVAPALVGLDASYQNLFDGAWLGDNGTSTSCFYKFKSRHVAIKTDGEDLGGWYATSILWGNVATLTNLTTGQWFTQGAAANNTSSTPLHDATLQLLVSSDDDISHFNLIGVPLVKIYRQTILPQ